MNSLPCESLRRRTIVTESAPAVVLDLGASNIGSLLRALRRIGEDVIATTDPMVVAASSAIIIPGVGSFAVGMDALQSSGMGEAVISMARDAATPVLGICLGFQLLTDGSDENGRHEGLGLLPGWTERLPEGEDAAVPHFGWSDVEVEMGQTIIPRRINGDSLYFAHSYSVVCQDEADVAMRIRYGSRLVTAAAGHGSVFGFQFHPELSQHAGLDCLASAMEWARTAAASIGRSR